MRQGTPAPTGVYSIQHDSRVSILLLSSGWARHPGQLRPDLMCAMSPALLSVVARNEPVLRNLPCGNGRPRSCSRRASWAAPPRSGRRSKAWLAAALATTRRWRRCVAVYQGHTKLQDQRRSAASRECHCCQKLCESIHHTSTPLTLTKQCDRPPTESLNLTGPFGLLCKSRMPHD